MRDRWEGIVRPYKTADVKKLQGNLVIKHTLAEMGAKKLWKRLNSNRHVAALGAMTGNQAVQQVRAGLTSVYVSGWQIAADNNTAGQTYPDMSLYPANSAPTLVKNINNALQRADQIDASEGKNDIDWFAPIVADAEAGFGGPLNAFELMKAMIEAGAAGVHFEDQNSSIRRCGHLSGKCLVPTSQFIKTLIAARLAADVCEVPTVLIARTDADSAGLITSDIDERDQRFIDKSKRTEDGFYELTGTGMERCVARGLAFAPYADVLWMETSTPSLEQAKIFAEAIKKEFPSKLLAFNCSPSFKWKKYLDDKSISSFQNDLAAMGYAFQFVTLAGFHTLNYSMHHLAYDYNFHGMSAYVRLQQQEFDAELHRGYTAVKHQREAGVNYYDTVSQVISSGNSSTLALKGSTESEQF